MFLEHAMARPLNREALDAISVVTANEQAKSIACAVVPTAEQVDAVAEWLPPADDPSNWASVQEAEIRVGVGAAIDIAQGQRDLVTIRRYQAALRARDQEKADREGEALRISQQTCDLCGGVDRDVKRDPAYWADAFGAERYILRQHLRRLPQLHPSCLRAIAWERGRRAAVAKVGKSTLGERASTLLDAIEQ